jgi:DNA polymerase III gamma/tau subunit
VIRVMPDPSKLLPYTADTVKAMYVTANKVSADTLSGYITYLSKEASEFKWSPDITTSFEIMMLRLCGKKSRLPVEPLVIPDFAARQAEAARKISFAAPETPAAEEEPEPEEPAKEEDPGPSAAPVSIFAKQKEAMKVKEEEPATEAEDTPDAPEPAESESQSEELPGQSSLFSFLSSSPFNTSSQGSGSDDAEDEDEGIAVCIIPNQCVMDQSDYL